MTNGGRKPPASALQVRLLTARLFDCWCNGSTQGSEPCRSWFESRAVSLARYRFRAGGRCRSPPQNSLELGSGSSGESRDRRRIPGLAKAQRGSGPHTTALTCEAVRRKPIAGLWRAQPDRRRGSPAKRSAVRAVGFEYLPLRFPSRLKSGAVQ